MYAIFSLFRSTTALRIGAFIALAGFVAWGALALVDSTRADCERGHQITLAEHIKRAAAQAHKMALQDAEISGAYEVWRTNTVYKTEEIVREIPASCISCALNPVGLSLLNAARAGTSPVATTPGQLDGGVSPIAPNQSRDDAGINRNVGAGLVSIQRLQGTALAADPGCSVEGI